MHQAYLKRKSQTREPLQLLQSSQESQREDVSPRENGPRTWSWQKKLTQMPEKAPNPPAVCPWHLLLTVFCTANRRATKKQWPHRTHTNGRKGATKKWLPWTSIRPLIWLISPKVARPSQANGLSKPNATKTAILSATRPASLPKDLSKRKTSTTTSYGPRSLEWTLYVSSPQSQRHRIFTCSKSTFRRHFFMEKSIEKSTSNNQKDT